MKFLNKLAFAGLTGSLLLSSSCICQAKDSTFGLMDAFSSLLSNEEITNAVGELMESDEVKSIIEFSTDVWNELPQEDKDSLISLGNDLVTNLMGIEGISGEYSDADFDMPVNITKEEAIEKGMCFSFPDNTEEADYCTLQDEEIGEVVIGAAATDSSDIVYYMYCFPTTETDVNAINYHSLGEVCATLDEQCKTVPSKVIDYDAVTLCDSKETVGAISWIDPENGMFYRFEATHMITNDDTPAITAEFLEENANAVAASEIE